MVFFSQRMLQIAIELALHDPLYEDLAIKFFEHTLWIAGAMDRIGDHQDELWDEEDGFFYDVLRLPDGQAMRLKVRSLVGLLPLMAVSVFPREVFAKLSRYHLEHPYCFYHGGQEFKVQYLPGDSNTGMFNGNSNWRGPIWMPVNFLLLRALVLLYGYYGDSFTIECPTGSGQQMTLLEVVAELQKRLTSIFVRNKNGDRPTYGGTEKFQTDPHWKDLVLFFEYFHGDNGAGIGANHQTGWTGCIARIIQLAGFLDKDTVLNSATVSDLSTYSM